MKLFKVNGVWHVRFQLGGKRISRTTREKSYVKARGVAESIYQAQLATSRGERPTPTLLEAVSEWLRVHDQLRSPDYVRGMELFGRQLHALSDLPLNRIGTAEVEDALALHAKTHSKASCCAWLRYLRAVFHWAVRRKALRGIPWSVPMPGLQKRRRVTLPLTKVVTWLEALDQVTEDPHIRLAVRLMLFLGLREAEALGARWENVDWEAQTYTPHKTKGKEASPIPANLVLDYLEPLAQPSGLMATGPGGKPHGHNYCIKAIRKANDLSGIHGISHHRLRGTFATLLHCVAGCDVGTVQRAMRHKDPRTTLLYLESVSDPALVAGLEKLKAKLGGVERVRLKSGEVRSIGARKG